MGFFYLTQLFFLLHSLYYHLFLLLFLLILFFTSFLEAMSPVFYWGRQTLSRLSFCIHTTVSCKPFLWGFQRLFLCSSRTFSFTHHLCFPSPFFIPLKSEICQVCFLITNRLLYLPLGSTAQGRSTYTNPSSILSSQFLQGFCSDKIFMSPPCLIFWFGWEIWKQCRTFAATRIIPFLLSVTLLCLWGLVSLQGPFHFLPSCFLGMAGLPECANMRGGRGEAGVCVCVAWGQSTIISPAQVPALVGIWSWLQFYSG